MRKSSAAITGGDSVTFAAAGGAFERGQHAFRQRRVADSNRHVVVKLDFRRAACASRDAFDDLPHAPLDLRIHFVVERRGWSLRASLVGDDVDAYPVWTIVTLKTAGSPGARFRERMVCSSITASAAITTGSIDS